MFKRARRTDVALAIGGAIVVAVIVVTGFVLLGEQQRRHREAHKDTSAYQADDGVQQWEAICTQLTSDATPTCIPQPPQSERDTHRADQDLRAQQEMADWALGVFFATLVGVATTIIGLIYVVRAYFINAEATKYASKAANAATTANEQTRAQFIAQQRPWLRASVVMANVASRMKDKVVGTAVFSLTNYGPSPASDVEVRLREPTTNWGPEEKSLFAHMTVVERQRQIEDGGDVVFPDPKQPLKLERDIVFTADGPMHVTGWARYRFQGAGRYHLTPFRIVVSWHPFTLGEKGRDQLRVTSVEDTAGIAPD